MIRVGVVGAAGRMGKTLVTAIHESKELQLSAAIEQAGLPVIGADAGEIAYCG